jgi:hypothetical protein
MFLAYRTVAPVASLSVPGQAINGPGEAASPTTERATNGPFLALRREAWGGAQLRVA